MRLETMRYISLLILFILIHISVRGSIHDTFVPDMHNPDQLIHTLSGKRLIPVGNSDESGQSHITQRPVSKWEYLRFMQQSAQEIPKSIVDLNSMTEQSFLGGLTYDEAESYCRYYGMDIPTYQDLQKIFQPERSNSFSNDETFIPDFEWTSDTTNLSSVDHRRILLSRANLAKEPRSMKSRDKSIGFRCIFNPTGRPLTELLLGYKGRPPEQSNGSKNHYLRIETNPAGAEVYEGAHYKHALGKTPFFGIFNKPTTQLVLKGDQILPQIFQIETPSGKGQILQMKLMRKPLSTLLDHKRAVSMALIPQGKVNIGLSFDERDRIKRAILSREANQDLNEERARIYLKNEGPDRSFMLSNFYIDQTEVTNAQYDLFSMESGKPRSRCSQVKNLSQPKAPVVCIDWTEAQDFCRFYGLTLPSEAQFEKAMQGIRKDDLKKPWHNRPRIAATQPADRSSFGVYDLGGNVMEWTSDWYDPELYSEGFILNPRSSNLIREEKTIKGTSFATHRLDQRPSKRRHKRPSHYAIDLGFRCVKSL